MTIWSAEPDLEALNAQQQGTISELLGIRFEDFDDSSLSASMPVDFRTKQPYGLLHGGASVVLAETLGSMASYLCIDDTKYLCVGMEINANHLRGVRAGRVTGVVRPVHLGRSTHVWDVRIFDESGKATCISRLTVAVVSLDQA